MNPPQPMTEKQCAAYMAEIDRKHREWLAKPLSRSEWVDLLMRCQNGEATCLYVLEKIEAEQGYFTREELVGLDAMALQVCHAIEELPASDKQTCASIQASAVSQTINRKLYPIR